MKQPIFLILFLVISSSAQAQVYQGKDASGKTIYSDRPFTGQETQAPAQNIVESNNANTDVKEENAVSTTPPTDEKKSEPKSFAEKEMDYRERQKAEKERLEKEKQEEELAIQKKRQCDEWSRYLQTLNSGMRIKQYDSDSSEYHYMDDNKRVEETEKIKGYLEGC